MPPAFPSIPSNPLCISLVVSGYWESNPVYLNSFSEFPENAPGIFVENLFGEKGIEPGLPAPKAGVLPVYYSPFLRVTFSKALHIKNHVFNVLNYSGFIWKIDLYRNNINLPLFILINIPLHKICFYCPDQTLLLPIMYVILWSINIIIQCFP